jgi:hypothetical protein
VPLVLDATVGAPTANAYATVAAAITAANYRIGPNAVAFIALTSDQQIQALVSAARDIDSLGDARVDGWLVEFMGERASDTQSMEWPRSGTLDFADDELPADLVAANIELAFTYAPLFAAGTADPLNADTSAARVKRKKVDVLETEWFEPGPTAEALERFPAMVQRLLSSLLDYRLITGQWGSAAVSRGS